VFGSIGWQELVMIFMIALLLFGPRKLPEIGRTIGKALSEFRRASNDLKRTIEEEVATAELQSTASELKDATRLPSVLDEPVTPAPTEGGGQGTTAEPR